MSSSLATMRTTATRPSLGRQPRSAAKRTAVVSQAGRQEPEARAPLGVAAAAAIVLALQSGAMEIPPQAQANQAIANQVSGAAKGAGSNIKGTLSGAKNQVEGAVKGAANQAQGSGKGVVNQAKGLLSRAPFHTILPGPLADLPGSGLVDQVAGKAKGLAADLTGSGKGAVSQAKGSIKGAANNAQGSSQGAADQFKNIFGKPTLKTLPNAGIAADNITGRAKGAASDVKGSLKGAANQAQGALKGAANQAQGSGSGLVDKVKGALSNSPISTLPNGNELKWGAQGAASDVKGNLKGAANQAQGALKGAKNQAEGSAKGLVNQVKGALSNAPISTLPGPGGYNNTFSDNLKDQIGDVSKTIRGSADGSQIGNFVNDRRNSASDAAQDLAGKAQDTPKPSVVDQVKSLLDNTPLSTLPSASNPMANNLNKVKGYASDAKEALKNAAGPLPGGNPGVNAGNPAAQAAKDVVGNAQSGGQGIVDSVKSALGVTPLTTLPSPLATLPSAENPMANNLNKIKGYASDAKEAVKNAAGPLPGGNPGVNAGNPAAQAAKDAVGNAQSGGQGIVDSVKSALGVTPLTTLPGPLANATPLPGQGWGSELPNSAVAADNATKSYNPPGARGDNTDYTKQVADALKRVPQDAVKAANEAADKITN